MFTGDDVRGALRYPDRYSPRSRLVSVEQSTNMAGGRVWPLEQLRGVVEVAQEHGLRLHMDGARLMNAVVASGVPAAEMTAGFDTAWLDFTKGLGAPLGAVPRRLGRADRGGVALQADARRRAAPGGDRRRGRAVRARPQRRAARGGPRERRARSRAGSPALDGVTLDPGEVETNIVIFEVDDPDARVRGVGARRRAHGRRRASARSGRSRTWMSTPTGYNVRVEAVQNGARMKLEGIHHITAITGDAPRNVDFYVRVLGLRLVKKTVNQDDPTVYHLFYADEHGSRGRGPDVLRVPERPRRAARARGWSTGSRTAWPPPTRWTSGPTGSAREGVDDVARGRRRCASPTRRGSSTSCVVVDVPDAPLRRPLDRGPGRARAARLPRRLRGGRQRRASPSALLTDDARLRGPRRRHAFEARGDARGGSIRFEPRGRPRLRRRGHDPPHRLGDARSTSTPRGASTSPRAGCQITPVIDRFYFRSVYFREPGGILYELASIGPGFTTDEPLERWASAWRCRPTSSAARAGRAAADAAAGRAPVAAGASRVSAAQRLSTAAAARRRRAPARRAGRRARRPRARASRPRRWSASRSSRRRRTRGRARRRARAAAAA